MRRAGLAIPAVTSLVAVAAITALASALALELVAALVAILALALETLAAVAALFTVFLALAFLRRALATFARLAEIAVTVTPSALLAGSLAVGRLRGRCGSFARLRRRGIAFALIAVAMTAATLVTRAALFVTPARTPDFDQHGLGGGFRRSGRCFCG